MSTDEQIKQPTIKELLDLLNDKDLKRSHNSVNISFKQMLAYVDRFRKDKPQNPGINSLLNSYLTMAEMYYTQFELSLLTEIVNQRDEKQHAEDAVRYIKKLQGGSPAKNTLEAINPLLVGRQNAAELEHQKLMENFPALLQSALDKLRNEWQRLNTLAIASQALTNDEKLYKSIKVVGEVAAHSVGIDAEQILIIPGNSFALYFFTYLNNFTVLTVPLHSVQTPWEWSIFWHELAGYKVRQLKKKTTLDAVKKNLTSMHEFYKTLSQEDEKIYALLDSVTLHNPFGWNYLYELFSIQRLNLEDIGGFENQFERILIELLNKETLQTYDRIKAQGWCIDWYKELFEDAWSVLAIGEPFLKFFIDILGRNSSKDSRHPPLEVRLRVAKEILRLQDPEGSMKNEPRSELIEEITAKQILKFITLLVAANRKIDGIDDQSQKSQVFIRNLRDEIFTKVSREIQFSINNWADTFLNADNPSLKAKNSTKKFLGVFSDPELEALLIQLEECETMPTRSNYRALLGNKNYKQLLEISFYEVDYHSPGDYELLENNSTYWVHPIDWDNNFLPQRHALGHGSALGTETIVTKIADNTKWKINKTDWEKWVKDGILMRG